MWTCTRSWLQSRIARLFYFERADTTALWLCVSFFSFSLSLSTARLAGAVQRIASASLHATPTRSMGETGCSPFSWEPSSLKHPSHCHTLFEVPNLPFLDCLLDRFWIWVGPTAQSQNEPVVPHLVAKVADDGTPYHDSVPLLPGRTGTRQPITVTLAGGLMMCAIPSVACPTTVNFGVVACLALALVPVPAGGVWSDVVVSYILLSFLLTLA